jgi:chromosome partitioning protein
VIIAVVSQKGGTDTTTVATNLAACYAAQGREVMLVDADPQHSALDWKVDRPPTLPPIHALHLPEKNLFQEVQHLRQKYDLVLIDGGGRITTTARAACRRRRLPHYPDPPQQIRSPLNRELRADRPSCSADI